MEGATIVVWLKDSAELINYDNDTKPVPGRDNEVISILHIENFSLEDQGNYTCYCYYNKTLVTSDKTISSKHATFYVHTNCGAG